MICYGNKIKFWKNYKDDLYTHQVMLNVECKKYLDDKLWSMGNVKLPHGYGIEQVGMKHP